MPQTKNNPSERIVRAVVQKMESLQLAGVQMIAKIPKLERKSPHPSPLPTAGAVPGEGTSTRHLPKAEGTSGTGIKAGHLASTTAVQDPTDPRSAALAEAARDVAACTRCAELVRNRTQTVFGVGNPYARLVFCGEAPGADEDRLGEPFVGRAGQLLTDIIVKGMKMRRRDVYILNILRCRPPGNRNPLPVEAAACREFLDRQLAIIQPEFICCLGAVAAQNLLQTDTPIGRLRGHVLDYHGIKVVCTYHPAYVLRNPSAKKFVWDDIQLLMAEMGMDKKDEG
jgi:uracil-DNA glycosylase family 4